MRPRLTPSIVFPALAGMSLARGDRPRRRGGFPRVSGDEPERIDDYSYTLEFSPRERG